MSRTKVSWFLSALACIALALGVTACGDDEEEDGGVQGGDVGELQIGGLVPLTGDLSPFGPPGRKAADLGGQELNKAARAGGVDLNVRMEFENTETKEQSAVSAARKQASAGAGCMVGPWSSAEVLAVGKSVASREEVPIVSPSSTSVAVTALDDKGFVSRTAPPDSLQARVLADKMGEKIGKDKRVSLAARNDSYGQGFADEFKKSWEAGGGQVLGPVLYDPEASSYDSEAGRIAGGNPDAFVIIDFPETYAKVGPALVRTGDFDPTKLFVTDGLASETIPEDKGVEPNTLDGSSGTRPGTPTEGEPAEPFDALYKQASGPKERGTFDAQNFDAVILCGLAAVAAGSKEGKDIAAQLKNVSGPPGDKFNYLQLSEALKALKDGRDIDFEGVTGPLDLDDKGDPLAATYEFYAYRNKTLEVDEQFKASK
jgi:ABC-type branched-subunit amino acid transport system substrate-binding protein